MAIRSALSFIDYTNRDWTTIRDAVVEHLRKRFPDDFADITESNLGVAFIEAISYMYEVLSFSLDRAANENFLATAQQRDSVAKLVGLLGYKLAPATAAAVGVKLLDVTEDRVFPLLISAGTVVSAGDVVFEIDDNYIITEVNNQHFLNGVSVELTNLNISAVEGSSYSEVKTGTDSKNQEFSLTRGPFIGGSMSLSVEGTPWTQVSSLAIGDPSLSTNGNIFELNLDGNDIPSVRFGDDSIGNIPVGTITISYRVGGGQRGNITSGAITGAVSATEAFDQGSSFTSSVQVTNSEGASGGSDRETITSAKTFAPAWARTMDRAITLADYEALSTGYSDGGSGRIAKASVVVGPSDGLSNVVSIYALAENIEGRLEHAEQPLKDSLHTFISDRKVLTTYLSKIQDGEIVNINLDLSVRLAAGFDKAVAIRRIEAVVNSLFKSSRVRYDNKLNSSWIHDYVVAVPGVVSCTIVSPTLRAITKDSTGGQLRVTDLLNLPQVTGLVGLSELKLSSSTINIDIPTFGEDYMVGADIVDQMGYTYRVLASDVPTGGSGVRCVLDKVTRTEYNFQDVTVVHPRKFRMLNSIELLTSSENESDLLNRRLHMSYLNAALSNDVDFSIDSYETTRGIYNVGRDFTRAPLPGDTFAITPDFLTSGTKTIDLGTVSVVIESGIA
jgi:hypothetical protein